MRRFGVFSVCGLALCVLACASNPGGPTPVNDAAAPEPTPPVDASTPSYDAGVTDGSPDGAALDAPAPVDTDKAIFDSVDKSNLLRLLHELTGTVPVTVDGNKFALTNRWTPGAKANFRAYWKRYFEDLGASVNEFTFPVDPALGPGETEGHNVEAILPGQSADSVVIIVHYDSVGITGQETLNPAADDDGSGLAMQMEGARIFSQSKNRKYTLRFVAADYEELTTLQGDDAYAHYLQKDAEQNAFKILVASDNDQTAWSCWDEMGCDPGAPAANTSFQMISCSGSPQNYDYPELAKGFTEVAAKYSTMNVFAHCDDAGDTDHYSFWTIGIPAYVIEEYSAGNNPHFDDTGDDTMKHINLDYFFHIAQIQITYQAKLAGITP